MTKEVGIDYDELEKRVDDGEDIYIAALDMCGDKGKALAVANSYNLVNPEPPKKPPATKSEFVQMVFDASLNCYYDADRMKAYDMIAKVSGFYKDDVVDEEDKAHNIMMVPLINVSDNNEVDEWENRALKQQHKLKELN